MAGEFFADAPFTVRNTLDSLASALEREESPLGTRATVARTTLAKLREMIRGADFTSRAAVEAYMEKAEDRLREYDGAQSDADRARALALVARSVWDAGQQAKHPDERLGKTV